MDRGESVFELAEDGFVLLVHEFGDSYVRLFLCSGEIDLSIRSHRFWGLGF